MRFLHLKVMIPPQRIDILPVASTNKTVITTNRKGKELGAGDKT